MNIQAYFLEFLGTIFFVYVILATNNPLAIGASLALVLLLIGNITGGYVNPAVTIALASAGKLPTSEVFPYILLQVFGGLIALEIYKRYKV